MATNRTFTMIKPDAVEKGHIGGILNMITEGGFRIVSIEINAINCCGCSEVLRSTQ